MNDATEEEEEEEDATLVFRLATAFLGIALATAFLLLATAFLGFAFKFGNRLSSTLLARGSPQALGGLRCCHQAISTAFCIELVFYIINCERVENPEIEGG